MITLAQYWMGRDTAYPLQLTQEIQNNAEITVERANALLELFGQDRQVASGWRPAAINSATPGAAINSRHITGQAVDLQDPDGDLDDWLFSTQQYLIDLELWQEHPASTKGWCHVQTIPPKSGRRVFFP